MPHLHNNCKKQTQILNCNVKQWGPSFVPYVQVLVIITICLFHQQLYNFKTEEHENTLWGSLIDVGCLCCNPLGPPVNMWTTVRVGLHVCIVRPLCKVCVSSVTCVTVMLKKCLRLLMKVRQSILVWNPMSQSVKLLLVAILPNALQPHSAHIKQHLTECDSRICTARLIACYYCSYMEQTRVELMIRHKYEPKRCKNGHLKWKVPDHQWLLWDFNLLLNDGLLRSWNTQGDKSVLIFYMNALPPPSA
jgi:hypothetical protein